MIAAKWWASIRRSTAARAASRPVLLDPDRRGLQDQDQILEHGKVQHARLGVTVQEVNQDLANSFKLETPTGALVASVEKGSAAERAGLQPGDVVRQINGKTIVSSGDLASMITLASPGDKLKLDVWRNGSPKELSATLGGVPKDKATASSDTRTSSAGSWAWRCARSVRRSSASPAPRVCSSSSPPALPPRPAYSRATCCCR